MPLHFEFAFTFKIYSAHICFLNLFSSDSFVEE